MLTPAADPRFSRLVASTRIDDARAANLLRASHVELTDSADAMRVTCPAHTRADDVTHLRMTLEHALAISVVVTVAYVCHAPNL